MDREGSPGTTEILGLGPGSRVGNRTQSILAGKGIGKMTGEAGRLNGDCRYAVHWKVFVYDGRGGITGTMWDDEFATVSELRERCR